MQEDKKIQSFLKLKCPLWGFYVQHSGYFIYAEHKQFKLRQIATCWLIMG
jgi:hypothetical protein